MRIFAAHKPKFAQMTENKSPRIARMSAWLCRLGCLIAAMTASLNLCARKQSEGGSGVQYFFLNCADWQYGYRQLREEFGPQDGQRVRVGQAAMFYIFERPMYTLVPELREHLRQARQYHVPLLVELDPVTFCNAVPDLWNWWDPAYYGYDERNRRNVEWTGWMPDSAVRVGWLNWGRQLRITPMLNLYSPAYWRHVRYRMNVMLGIVSEWYNALPEDERWLLCGVKVTGELAFGVNNWYFPGGNDLLDRPEADDPQLDMGQSMRIMPSRGAQTIGYAALSSSGIRRKGEISARDIYRLEARFQRDIGRLVRRSGFPREMLFGHAGGCAGDLGSCLNRYVCPAWSFYNEDAHRPEEAGAMQWLALSDAPYYAAAEFSLWEEPDPEKWKEALLRHYAIPRCRYVALFTADGKFIPGSGAVEGIKRMQREMNDAHRPRAIR